MFYYRYKLVVFLTSLHCTFMLHIQRECLNSRWVTVLSQTPCAVYSENKGPPEFSYPPFAYQCISGVPRNFFQGGFNKFSWGQREWGFGGGSPLGRGSGGSCNLVQEISFHMVKFS